jgi:hypothetical protein
MQQDADPHDQYHNAEHKGGCVVGEVSAVVEDPVQRSSGLRASMVLTMPRSGATASLDSSPSAPPFCHATIVPSHR